MKKIFTLFAVLLLSFAAQAEKFPEGDYYKVLDLPHSDAPVVNEFFSFYCPHCHDFEPVMNALEEHVKGKADFQKVPVSFMGGNMGKPMSKAYATMVSLGVDDKLVPFMFSRIHDQRNPPRNEEELRQIFLDNGVSAEDFDGTYNSFAIDSMVRRFDKSFEDAGLTGVPAIIVNNKYYVDASKIKTTDEYFELIDFLLKK